MQTPWGLGHPQKDLGGGIARASRATVAAAMRPGAAAMRPGAARALRSGLPEERLGLDVHTESQ